MRYLVRALPSSYSYIEDFIDVIPEEQRKVDYVKSKIKEKNMTSSEPDKKSNIINASKDHKEVTTEVEFIEVMAKAKVKVSSEVSHSALNKMALRQSHGLLRFWSFPLGAINIYNPEDIEVILSDMKYHQKSQVYSFLKPWLQDGLLLSYETLLLEDASELKGIFSRSDPGCERRL
ncbi:unnamed protein product [Parnassius apollo]|uniref:(apollo) hypothetical protein n=1 Tax=Parnassius apollo TaxID=110799 RepID=A0A8S3WSC7_PARAO|nr:unnamed protein product [Parnassius apollo]